MPNAEDTRKAYERGLDFAEDHARALIKADVPKNDWPYSLSMGTDTFRDGKDYDSDVGFYSEIAYKVASRRWTELRNGTVDLDVRH